MARIIVFGPHPDDQELGMGGTIALLAAQGHHVLIIDATDGEPTPYGDPETRKKETDDATRVLSPDPDRPIARALLGLPNRSVEHTLAARHLFAAAIRAHQADIVFAPYFEDAHPDHIAVTRIAEDARFDAKLTKLDLPLHPALAAAGYDRVGPPLYPRWFFYYYCTHLRHVAQPSFLVDVSEHIETKLRAVRAYASQFVVPEKNRPVVEWLEAQGRYFGSRIGVRSAEPFYTREPVGLGSLSGLVGV